MVGWSTCTQTRVSRDNNRNDASYNLLFSHNSVSMKKRVGMHLVCYCPYWVMVVHFSFNHPTYSTHQRKGKRLPQEVCGPHAAWRQFTRECRLFILQATHSDTRACGYSTPAANCAHLVKQGCCQTLIVAVSESLLQPTVRTASIVDNAKLLD